MLPLTLTTVVALAVASSGGPAYDLSWHTIDGGGGTSVGATFTLEGTIGQPDADLVLTGATFSLAGGFWSFSGGAALPCEGDLDGNGSVGASDLAVLLGGWGTPAGDITGDGTTDAADLAVLLGAWGPC